MSARIYWNQVNRGARTLFNEGCKLATNVYAQAHKYVSVERPDPNRDYYFEKTKDKIVLLTGQAKNWGIDYQSLQNEKVRSKNLCSLVGNLFAGISYHKGFWDHSWFYIALTFPILWGSRKVAQKMDQYYDPKITTIKKNILRAVENSPVVDRSTVVRSDPNRE